MGGRGPLVGRERELADLRAFVDEPGTGGLVLTGEAGVGKTVLWEHATQLAARRGATVLRATPGEGEERFSFAVLHDLFRDVDLGSVGLRPPVAAALAVVLLRASPSGPVDTHLVDVGVEDILAHLTTAGEVFVFIDDAQWADPDSMAAVTFAARRLRGSPVRFVLTRRAGFSRTPVEAVLVRQQLSVVEPRALSRQDTARLLREQLGLTLTPRAVRLVHEQSGGNPLFLLEIGRVLQRRGVPEIGEQLAVPSDIAEVLGLRVRELPDEHRLVLLAVALDPHLKDTDLAELVGLAVVEGAADAGVLSLAPDGRARPWHPLLGAAAREASTPARRRDLHRRLAEVVRGADQRARHLALMTDEADEGLAAQLSEETARAARRGASETALELAELALAKTPDGAPERVQRVLELAMRMAVANEAQRLTDFLEPEIERIPPGAQRGQALLMLLDGIWGDRQGIELVVDRALAESAGDVTVRSHALEAKSYLAGGIAISGVAQAMAWAEEALSLRATPDAQWRMVSDARSWCLVHLGRPPEPAEGLPYWKRLIWRGELGEAERLIRAAIDEAEASGHHQQAIVLLPGLCDVLLRGGRIAEAREHAAAQADVDLTARESPELELLLAEIEICFGDAPRGRDLARLALDRAAAKGHNWLCFESERALATAALQAGDPEEAAQRLGAVFDHLVAAGVREPGMIPVAPSLVEALAGLGRYDDARRVLAWLDEVSTEQAHPWGSAMVSRSRTLLGLLEGSVSPQEAAAGVAAVARELCSLGLVHDAARAHLVVGSVLRRQRQWGLAREQLSRAAELFESLGADGWAATVRGELGRVGGRRPAADGQLSTAELEVCRLAVDGLANKTIARQLNVSVSTVEAHLTRAFGKLGVQSRTQLAGRLRPR